MMDIVTTCVVAGASFMLAFLIERTALYVGLHFITVHKSEDPRNR